MSYNLNLYRAIRDFDIWDAEDLLEAPAGLDYLAVTASACGDHYAELFASPGEALDFFDAQSESDYPETPVALFNLRTGEETRSFLTNQMQAA